MNNQSIIKIISLYYLILLNPLSSDLLHHKIKTLVEDNRYVQHIISIMTIFVLINLIYPDGGPNNLLFTIICYVFFIFTTKIELQINIIIIFFLIGIYFSELIIDNKNKSLESDNYISNDKKNKIILQRNYVKYGLYIIIGLITFIGLFFYSNKKTEQYGGSYSILNFFAK